MKRPKLTVPVFVVRHSWVLAMVAVLVVFSASLFVLNRHYDSPPEGGQLQTQQAPKVVAKLPDTAAPAAETAQTAAATNCSQNGLGKLLLVSISQQHIWACDGTALANQSAVTTGASALTNVDDATPTGTWRIYSKQTNTTLKGCDVNGCWNDPVAYWMPFDDQVGFHDASWQTFPFGSSLYTTQGSHGCVHLPLDFIAWVYNWAPVGTTVTVES
jgi:lipoprotein-anchoring transpeptidase ErfK/SrfK